MKMKKKLYTAYGSNLNLGQMARRCPTARVLGASVLKDHQLMFRGARWGSVATVEPCEGGSVPVLVWEITPEDEKALDFYEGYPFLYGKETVGLPLKGKTVKAMVYVMTPGRLLGQPGGNYYSAILEGYRCAGFDPAVLKEAADRSKEQQQND